MENLQLILKSAAKGVWDAVSGVVKLYRLRKSQKENSQTPSTTQRSSRKRKSPNHENPSIMTRLTQCCLLNGVVFWCSIILFYNLVVPGSRFILEFMLDRGPIAEFIWSWFGPVLTLTFDALWVMPLFCLSKFVNSLWFQDIAESAYRQTGGRRHHISGFSKLIADFLFSIVVQFLFLVQAMVCNLIPLAPVAQLVSLFHICLLYSLYAFEYKWFNNGWELHKRLSFIENNWPYFFGFGLPLAVLTTLEPSYVISGCIFSILFPLLIVGANEAEPVVGICDFPIRLFSPVIWVSNAIFQRTMNPTRLASLQKRRGVESTPRAMRS